MGLPPRANLNAGANERKVALVGDERMTHSGEVVPHAVCGREGLLADRTKTPAKWVRG
jgi:hypothetical protein